MQFPAFVEFLLRLCIVLLFSELPWYKYILQLWHLLHFFWAPYLFDSSYMVEPIKVTFSNKSALWFFMSLYVGPLIQSVQISLQSFPTLQQTNTSTQLGVICKLSKGSLSPLIHIKILYRIEHKTEPWGTPVAIVSQVDVTPFDTTLWHHPFRPFYTQQTIHLPSPWDDNFSRRMLWVIVSNALLKSR